MPSVLSLETGGALNLQRRAELFFLSSNAPPTIAFPAGRAGLLGWLGEEGRIVKVRWWEEFQSIGTLVESPAGPGLRTEK